MVLVGKVRHTGGVEWRERSSRRRRRESVNDLSTPLSRFNPSSTPPQPTTSGHTRNCPMGYLVSLRLCVYCCSLSEQDCMAFFYSSSSSFPSSSSSSLSLSSSTSSFSTSSPCSFSTSSSTSSYTSSSSTSSSSTPSLTYSSTSLCSSSSSFLQYISFPMVRKGGNSRSPPADRPRLSCPPRQPQVATKSREPHVTRA